MDAQDPAATAQVKDARVGTERLDVDAPGEHPGIARGLKDTGEGQEAHVPALSPRALRQTS